MEALNYLHPVTKLFLAVLSIKVVVQNYLDLRQRKSIKKNYAQVPPLFEKMINLEEHQKALNYNLEKLSFGKVLRSFRLITLLLWTIGGGIELLGRLTINSSSSYSSISFFLLSYILIETVVGIPASWYSNFHLEEKYGFNKLTKKLFFQDLIKSTLITIIISIPIFLVLIKLLQELGDLWWAYAWGVFMLFQIALIFIFPTFIAPLFNKFTPLEDGSLKDKLYALLEKINFNAQGFFTMDASKRSAHGNAYFTGFGKNKRIVLFDTLLEQMNENEILAVLAHELGHFKKKHILKSIILSSIGILIIFFCLAQALKSQSFLQGHGLITQGPAVSVILFLMITPIYTFLLTPLSNIFSRKNEFEADRFACEHTSAEDMKTALLKLYKHNFGNSCPDEYYSAFYDSHPPASIRIKAIEDFSRA